MAHTRLTYASPTRLTHTPHTHALPTHNSHATLTHKHTPHPHISQTHSSLLYHHPPPAIHQPSPTTTHADLYLSLLFLTLDTQLLSYMRDTMYGSLSSRVRLSVALDPNLQELQYIWAYSAQPRLCVCV